MVWHQTGTAGRSLRIAVLVAAGVLLAACSTHPDPATDAEIARAVYRHPGPPSISLITVRGEDDDIGVHTGLMINASQRVIFDPAGSFGHSTLVERGDVFFGATPDLEKLYYAYYARLGFYITRLTIEVPAEVAEQALRAATLNGKVDMSMCTFETAGLLAGLPGFEAMPSALFPSSLMTHFADLPGVAETELHETDFSLSQRMRATYDWRYDFEDWITLD